MVDALITKLICFVTGCVSITQHRSLEYGQFNNKINKKSQHTKVGYLLYIKISTKKKERVQCNTQIHKCKIQ